MKILSGITRFLYMVVLLLLGASLIAVSLKVIPQEEVITTITQIYEQPNFRLAIGFAGLLVIAIFILIIQIAISKIEREKTLAFDNPDGRVTVSLTAIEDFMKRLGHEIPEIRELKPKVIATKKGVVVNARIVLYSDMSIPNMTEKIQSIIKNRVQDMLGIEEPIIVKVHIYKLLNKDELKKKKGKREAESEERAVPQYRGVDYSEG